MSFNIGKEDLRSLKTEKALNEAMFTLLELQNFKKLTVRDICEEALISRATFYAHYIDKYDLLKRWLVNLKPSNISGIDTYEKIERIANQFISKNEKRIKNIISDADNETLNIVFHFILTFMDLLIEKEQAEKINLKYVVFSNIFAGGMIYYLLWHIENKFQSEVMNIHLYNLIKRFREWESI